MQWNSLWARAQSHLDRIKWNFAGAEPFNEHAEKFGPAISLQFRVTEGEQKGAIATRICSQKLSPKSTLAKFIIAIKGGPIATGEKIAIESLIGVRGLAVVEPTESGSKVAAFVRTAAPAAESF